MRRLWEICEEKSLRSLARCQRAGTWFILRGSGSRVTVVHSLKLDHDTTAFNGLPLLLFLTCSTTIFLSELVLSPSPILVGK